MSETQSMNMEEGGSQGTDHNGLITGRWKAGLFGCTDTLVPNAIMSCLCPAISVAQIAARVNMLPFYHCLGAFGALYLIALISVATHSKFFNVIMWLATIVCVLCMTRMRWRIRTLFSIPGSMIEDLVMALCCGCCSIAQMASHVESYEPGVFAFQPRETLQGYSYN